MVKPTYEQIEKFQKFFSRYDGYFKDPTTFVTHATEYWMRHDPEWRNMLFYLRARNGEIVLGWKCNITQEGADWGKAYHNRGASNIIGGEDGETLKGALAEIARDWFFREKSEQLTLF